MSDAIPMTADTPDNRAVHVMTKPIEVGFWDGAILSDAGLSLPRDREKVG